MEIAKCNVCSQEVGEVGRTYYEVWEKKKEDFGLGRKEKIFCENCWKEQEKEYRNWPCDTKEIKRRITRQEISEKTSSGFTASGDWICYDPTKKEWVKGEIKINPPSSENKPTGKGNDNLIIWIVLVVMVMISLLFLGYLWHKWKRKSRKRQK